MLSPPILEKLKILAHKGASMLEDELLEIGFISDAIRVSDGNKMINKLTRAKELDRIV